MSTRPATAREAVGHSYDRLVCREVPKPSEEPDSSELAIERELVRRLELGRVALPVLPAVAQMAIRVANDPDARTADLASLLDSDPAIAARFMSLANDVIYLRGWITSSTSSAITRLGLASTRDLLFQLAISGSAGGLEQYAGPARATLRRSVLAAHAARVVSRELSIATEYDYLSGLLHDMGEARIYRILDGIDRPVAPALAAALVHEYHEAAGADVAIAWQLPTEIVQACAAHHAPTAAASPHVRLVMIADCIVTALEPQARRAESPIDFEPFDQLLVDPSIARRLIEKTRLFLG